MQRKTQEEVWKEYVLRTLRQFRRILTTQGSHIGEVISTDGTNLIWTTVSGGSSLPDQTGNNGKYLTTNGSTVSWATVTIPSLTWGSLTGTLSNQTDLQAVLNSKQPANSVNQQTVTALNTTVNLANGNIIELTLQSNTNLNFTGGELGTYVFKLIQDNVGGRLITSWPSTVKWSGGIAPTLSTTANKIDIITLVKTSDNFYGAYMLNF